MVKFSEITEFTLDTLITKLEGISKLMEDQVDEQRIQERTGIIFRGSAKRMEEVGKNFNELIANLKKCKIKMEAQAWKKA